MLRMALSGAVTPEMKRLSEQACDAGEKFVKLFYETYDKRRYKLSNLYLDTASLVWNGTLVTGPADILKFLDSLPVSEHHIESADAQSIPSGVTAGHTSIFVCTIGTVKYTDNPQLSFVQEFVLTSVDNKWKIVSNTVRTYRS